MPFFSYLPVSIPKIKPRKILSCQNLEIGPLQLSIHVIQNRYVGKQKSQWGKTNKRNT